MKPISVAVVGTGWCGGIRAETLRGHALVRELHLAETRAERLAQLKHKLAPASAVADYQQLLDKDIQAVYVSAAPESTHYPIAKDFLSAGKHLFLEKPMAMTLEQADELIGIAQAQKLKFTIGYSQRFNPKFAYVRKCIRDATIGRPVSALVSRHITRMLGSKISGRSKLSPAAMEATHDLDFLFWCLEPAKPVRVYSQVNYGALQEQIGSSAGGSVPDQQWLMVTMDSGMSIVVGGGWSLPLGYPNFSSTWIEMIGTEGAVMVDDSHKDVMVNTVKNGMQLPMSTMPGEFVEHTYAGPMAPETVHFLEAVVYDREVMVKPGHARMVMEVYLAADLSAQSNAPVSLPLKWQAKPRSVSASR